MWIHGERERCPFRPMRRPMRACSCRGGDTIRALKVIVDATGYDLRQARDIVYALIYDIEVPRRS